MTVGQDLCVLSDLSYTPISYRNMSTQRPFPMWYFSSTHDNHIFCMVLYTQVLCKRIETFSLSQWFWQCSPCWCYPVNTNKICYKLFLCVCVNWWKNDNIVLSVMVQGMAESRLNGLPQKLEAKRHKVLFCSGFEWQKCKTLKENKADPKSLRQRYRCSLHSMWSADHGNNSVIYSYMSLI